MKPNRCKNPFIRFAHWSLAAVAISFSLQSATAATRVKLDNTDSLDLASSWFGGAVPTSADIATWDTTVTGANAVNLGSNQSWNGIAITNPGGAVTINAGNTLTLGTGGINMSSATQNLTISSGLAIGAGNQVWNIASGRTLTLNTGTFTRNAGATLNIQGTGTVAASMTGISNTNGIVGAWATVGTGTSTRYATLSAGNLVGYSGATAASTAGNAWGGIPSGGTGLLNYEISISGTPGLTGLNRNVNSIRYTGSGLTQGGNTNALLLNANGILNVGSGTLVIGGAANQFSIAASSTTTNEMVLAAANADITINATVVNNGSNASVLTVTGPGLVTLVGNNTFSGNLNINSGTLAAGTGQGAAPTASNLGALQPAANRNIIVNNGGTLSLTGGNVLGTGGSTNTLSNTTLVVNSGGVFQTGLNGSGTGWWNKIGATNLNGGTIHVGSGANTGAFQGLALIGTVTAGGNSASVIDNFAASNSASNGVHLGQNATAGQSIIFDVADVTGSTATDLTVATNLLNTSSTLTASGLTKSGAGTMTLTGANAYTGTTTISGGTLQIGAGGTSGSLSGSSAITNNAALVFNRSDSWTQSNAISGNGSVTKLGGGNLTLSGGSNYVGATSVNAGTLTITGSLTSNISVASGATVSGSGSTTGSLTMSGGSTFAAGTTGAAFTANGVNFTGATKLIFNGATTDGATYDLFFYGAGGVTNLSNLSSSFRTTLVDTGTKVTGTVNVGTRTWSGTNGTWEINGAGTNWSEGDQKYFDGDTVVFGNPAAASTITLNGSLIPLSVTVNNTNAYTFSGSGSISGSSSLTKSGSGALTVSTANSYTGGTVVNGGSLVMSGNNNFGTGAVTVNGGMATLSGANTFTGGVFLNGGAINADNASALGGGTVTITGGSLDNTSGAAITLSTNNAQAWNGDFLFTGTNNLNMGSGNVTLGGTGNRTVAVDARTLTVGKITGASQGLTKSGAGILAINSGSASSVTGTLNVSAGTLQMNTGADTATTNDFLATGLAGSGTITNGGGVERWLIITSAGTDTFSGSLANGGVGALGFSKQGAGSTTLSGSNSYTGATTVGGGILTISGANSGAGTNVSVNTGTLVLANTSALGANSLIRMAGSNVSTLGIATDGGDNAYALTMGTGTIANIVSDRATSGAGINHTLTTQALANGIGGGTINVTSGANVTSGQGRITFTQFGMGAGSVQTTTLNPTTANVTIGDASKQNNNVSQTLGLGGTSQDNHVTGVISNGPALTGSNNVSVAKTDSSKWTLSGNNTYTGATTVSAGTLLVNGSLGNTSSTNVTGGTLGGTGSIASTVSVTGAGSSLSPGASIESLSTGALTMGSGSVFVYEAANASSTGADLLAANGALSLTSVTLDLTGADLAAQTWAVGSKITLISYTGTGITSGFTGYDDDTSYLFDSNEWVFNYNDDQAGGNFYSEATANGTSFVTMTLVPEPSAAVLGSLGMLALMRRRRH